MYDCEIDGPTKVDENTDPEVKGLGMDCLLIDGYVSHCFHCVHWKLFGGRQVDDEECPVPNAVKNSESLYELTLTTINNDPKQLMGYLEKIVNSKMFGINYFEAVFELQKNGNPHIHSCLWSSKNYIDGSKIRSKTIGFPYIYHLSRVKDKDNYLKYMKKDVSDNVTTKYCEEHGVPHYWTSENIA